MRIMLAFSIIFLACPVSAQQLLWDNGAWSMQRNLASMRQTNGPIKATVVDDAVFTTSVHVTSFSWDAIFRPRDGTPAAADVVVLSKDFESLYELDNLSYSREWLGTDRGLPVYRTTVEGLDVNLPQGRYYFGGRSVGNENEFSYSELQLNGTHGVTEAYFQSDYYGVPTWTPAGEFVGEHPELAFRLYGEPVPEPATLLALGTALGLLCLRKRR